MKQTGFFKIRPSIKDTHYWTLPSCLTPCYHNHFVNSSYYYYEAFTVYRELLSPIKSHVVISLQITSDTAYPCFIISYEDRTHRHVDVEILSESLCCCHESWANVQWWIFVLAPIKNFLLVSYYYFSARPSCRVDVDDRDVEPISRHIKQEISHIRVLMIFQVSFIGLYNRIKLNELTASHQSTRPRTHF